VYLLLCGILFVFSILSIIFSFDGLIKDVVFSAGFLTAIIINIYYRMKNHKEHKENA
jgi:hypothetical protein